MKGQVFITLLISFVFVLSAPGQKDTVGSPGSTDVSIGGLFESDELLEITLNFDIRFFQRNKHTNEQQDALMTYSLNEQDTVTREIRVRARGHSRRTFCSFPPIRLNLRENEPPDDIFTGFDKIKMVTHCNARDSDYVLREYLVYKLYNVFTDYSYRVRPLKVNYVTTRRLFGRPFTSYGYLIEPDEFLVERTNTVEVERGVSQAHIRPEIMIRVSIFNYMIGNYDYSVPLLQNLVVLSQPVSEQAHLGIVVPYDFDYTGLVHPPYAVPPEDAPISSIKERLYLGICRSEEEFKNALDEFLEKKEELYDVINNFPYMNDRSKRYMTEYLDSFYDQFDEKNTILYKLLNECLDI